VALHRLRTEAENHSRTLYGNNQMVYGLPRYGTIGTPEKHFLAWKEDEADDSRFKLDKYLLKLCDKSRLIELMHDLVLLDGRIKKLPRVHQYVGVKAA
jgi:type I restriction enzyme R subunit